MFREKFHWKKKKTLVRKGHEKRMAKRVELSDSLVPSVFATINCNEQTEQLIIHDSTDIAYITLENEIARNNALPFFTR